MVVPRASAATAGSVRNRGTPMLKCQVCQKENPAGAEYCEDCGAALNVSAPVPVGAGVSGGGSSGASASASAGVSGPAGTANPVGSIGSLSPAEPAPASPAAPPSDDAP